MFFVASKIAPTVVPTKTASLSDTLSLNTFVQNVLLNLGGADFVTFVKLLTFWLVVAWLLATVWVLKDALQRYENLVMPVFWFIIVLPFNLLGLLAYVILRPYEYSTEFEQDKLTLKLYKAELVNFIECPVCGEINSRSGAYCTECGQKLVETCPKCGESVWIDWWYCKNCGIKLDDNLFKINGQINDGGYNVYQEARSNTGESDDIAQNVYVTKQSNWFDRLVQALPFVADDNADNTDDTNGTDDTDNANYVAAGDDSNDKTDEVGYNRSDQVGDDVDQTEVDQVGENQSDEDQSNNVNDNSGNSDSEDVDVREYADMREYAGNFGMFTILAQALKKFFVSLQKLGKLYVHSVWNGFYITVLWLKDAFLLLFRAFWETLHAIAGWFLFLLIPFQWMYTALLELVLGDSEDSNESGDSNESVDKHKDKNTNKRVNKHKQHKKNKKH